jgi:hypothetical protein
MTDHKKDISIGDDQWIEWIDIDRTSTRFDLDNLLLPTKSFWEALETECVSGCCGIDAFVFWPEDIRIAKEQFSSQALVREFIILKANVIAVNEEVVGSSFFNCSFQKTVFLKLIDHIGTNLSDDFH